MSVGLTRPFQHTQTAFAQGKLPSLGAAQPLTLAKPTGMQEPNTNYVIIMTASGPQTIAR